MPIHNGWLPREGFTADVLLRAFQKTALNPALTALALLAAKYTKQGSDFSILHEKAFGRIRILFWLGLLRAATKYLDRGALDSWKKDHYDWEKEIVLITGGAGGIGGHVVKLLSERGIRVVVLDVIPMTFETPNNVAYYKCDITSPSTIASVAAEIRRDVGEPTIIINNAGVVRGKSILDSTEKDIRFTFDVNTIAHYFVVQEFLPSLVKKDHGMVVTVASYAAFVTAPRLVDYASSKAAALAFHEGLTAELKTVYNAPKVRTVVINQGYTKTPLFAGWGNESKFILPTLQPESVADEIVKKVLAGRSGQVILPEFGGFLALMRGFPHWFQMRVRNGAEKHMATWTGRQTIDLESWKTSKDKEGSETASTVLVPPASS